VHDSAHSRGSGDRPHGAPSRAWVPFTLGVLLAVLAGTVVRGVSAQAGIDGSEGSDLLPAPVAVVRVEVDGCREQRVGAGTVVGDGVVVTARHVMGDAARAVVIDAHGAVGATVTGIDPLGRDLAVLRLDESLSTPPARLAWDPGAGDDVVAHGHPRGGPVAHVALSVVSVAPALAYEQPGEDLLVLDGELAPGMSGGPVTDPAGLVRGLVLGTETRSRTGLAIPVEELADVLETPAPPPASPC